MQSHQPDTQCQCIRYNKRREEMLFHFISYLPFCYYLGISIRCNLQALVWVSRVLSANWKSLCNVSYFWIFNGLSRCISVSSYFTSLSLVRLFVSLFWFSPFWLLYNFRHCFALLIFLYVVTKLNFRFSNVNVI